MIGIIAAGGNSTRLFPLTLSRTKHLLPIYGKPMIYYPISNLMLMNIKEIIIVTKQSDINDLKKCLGNGRSLGIKIYYVIQKEPKGVADVLICAKKFIKNNEVCLILGDNIFYGSNFNNIIMKSANNLDGGKIFLYSVENPERYGVVKINKKNKKITSIIEKPKTKKNRNAITGIYLFDKTITKHITNLKKSKRGELEIVDVLKNYNKISKLKYEILDRGIVWIDAGTTSNIFRASEVISVIESRTKFKIGCIESVAYEKKLISKNDFKKLINKIPDCEYKAYLEELLD